jgi:uncharacterized membrane protein YeaQ/YmgE (transglycosylase-associated protein family)
MRCSPSVERRKKIMLAIEIISWVVLGLVLGGASYYFSKRRALGVTEVIIVGIVGALLGGFLSRGLGGAGTFGRALIAAGVGSIVVLLIDWSMRGWRGGQQEPRT